MTSMAVSDVDDAKGGLELLWRRLAADAGSGASRSEWAALVTACQRVVNTATAVQDLAISRLVAIEEEWLEDGTTAELRRAPGHVALDGPDVVAGALGVAHLHAQRRTALAVRLVAGAGDAGAVTGLSALHTAMSRGDLDSYRASVVVEELEEAPPEVAEAVVEVLVPNLGTETPVQLRRRCRRALARISPDLLRQRAKRARESCGLRRWADEPGVDRWEGTFPSEQAAEGWAAVDGLAHRYVAEGRCSRVEAARAQALMDLVRGSATIDVQLVLTVPAAVAGGGVTPGCGADAGPDAVSGARTASPPRTTDPSPGAARGCASASMATWPMTLGDEAGVVGVPRLVDDAGAGPQPAPGDDADDFVEVGGPFPGEPVLVGRGWIGRFLAAAAAAAVATAASTRSLPERGRALGALATAQTRVEECDAVTGALLGGALSGGALSTGRTYRPTRRVAALVRARDGRCRFPGCSVAARFCDLDHVRPWPGGPTEPANLLCLCRRHHRIKQRPGWSIRLAPDGRAVWRDPTGRTRITMPRDLLDTVVLPAPAPRLGTGAPLQARMSRGSAAGAAPGAVAATGVAGATSTGVAGATRSVAGGATSTVAGATRSVAGGSSALEVILDVLSDPGGYPTRARRSPPSSAAGSATDPTAWEPQVRVTPPGPRRLRYADAPGGHVRGRPDRTMRRGIPTGRHPHASEDAPPPF